MATVTLILRLHQPYVLARYDALVPGEIFDHAATRRICRTRARRSIVPVNRILADLSDRLGESFRCTCLVSGVALELFDRYSPDVIESLADLVRRDVIEIAVTPYDYDLCFLTDPAEFADRVQAVCDRVEGLFGRRPTTFANTDLILTDVVVRTVESAGLTAIVCDASGQVAAPDGPGRRDAITAPPTVRPGSGGPLRLIVRDAGLSHMVDRDFMNRASSRWPVTAPRYAACLAQASRTRQPVVLLWDYVTFGERYPADTGVFDFLAHLPSQALERGVSRFQCCRASSGVAADPAIIKSQPPPTRDADRGGRWAAAAMVGGSMQARAADCVYSLKNKMLGYNSQVIHSSGQGVRDDWRRLRAVDYLRCFTDPATAVGDMTCMTGVGTAYEAFVAYMGHCDTLGRRAAEPRRRG